MKRWIFLILMLLPAWSLASQEVDHQALSLAKQIDDVLWYQKAGDVAYIDKVYIPTVPRWKKTIPLDREPAIRSRCGHTSLFQEILILQKNTR